MPSLPHAAPPSGKADIQVSALEDNHTQSLAGRWLHRSHKDTAGGPARVSVKGSSTRAKQLGNPNWCQNPQFLLGLQPGCRRASVKVVCTRTDHTGMKKGKREGSRNYVGLSVTKVAMPMPDNPKRKKLGAKKVNALGEAVRTLASELPSKRNESNGK